MARSLSKAQISERMRQKRVLLQRSLAKKTASMPPSKRIFFVVTKNLRIIPRSHKAVAARV